VDLSVAGLKAGAAAVGLDQTAFDQCLDSAKYKSLVDQSLQDGRTHKFLGTPTFLINDRPVPGVPGLDYFASIIDPLLAGR
jgi:protein-disulfide isomerase